MKLFTHKKSLFYKINKNLKEEFNINDTFISTINNKDTLKQYIEFCTHYKLLLKVIKLKT